MHTLVEQFFNKGKVENIRKDIIKSWTRCREKGLDPSGRHLPTRVSSYELETRIVSNKRFVEIGKRILDSTFGKVANLEIGWGVFDADAVALHANANSKEFLNKLNSMHLWRGSQVSEENVGTNAMNLALLSGVANRVTGPEHYCSLYYWITSVGSPVRDRYGRILGAIACSNYHNKHSLRDTVDYVSSLIIQAATAIEIELKLQEDLYTIGETISDPHVASELVSRGILVTNREGVIILCNRNAESFIGLRQIEVIGHDVRELFPDLPIDSSVMRGPETHNVDRYLSVQLSPIHDTEGNPSGILIIVHPTKQTLEGHSPRTGHVARYVFEDIVGSSSPIREVIRWAKIASKHSFTILLEGETGSGKEILAHAIHNNSLRSRGPFVAINCSAIPKDLVESELFGYIGGAFTGSRKEGGKGKLEIAHRGTLLLDEVDSLPLETQAKLLRFLESGEIIRVGDTKLSNVDVRVIACTSVNLDEQVQRGTFRKDLYYRLNVFKIEIPPLRKRKEDILLLANSILNNLVGEKPGLSSELHPRVSELLLAHDWPGNVRELRNCLKHAVAMASKGEILPEDLPASLHKNVGLSADSHQDENPFVTMERELLACALTEGHGNPEEAARLLGVSRATMYRKIKKYDLLQKKSIPS